MLGAQILLIAALLPVCSFAPGFFVIRRLRWTPLEKLCGAVALSLILLYLVAFAGYIFAEARQAIVFAVYSGVCVLLAILARRDWLRLATTFRVRRSLQGLGFLAIWTALLLAMIRNYSGGKWSGDWIEHFHRCLFFLHHYPVTTSIFGGYAMPARPPLMNLLGAFFMALSSDRFEIYQVIFAFLNLLVFLPACLIMPALLRRMKKWRILPLVAIFALSPVAMQNITYAWTKALTAFFVILAFSLYLSGLRKKDSQRVVAAFVAMAAGVLVHYSAGPYLLFLGLHYVCFGMWKQPRRWRELAMAVTLSSLLLFSWIGWSLKVYGKQDTFASNTSVTSSQQNAGHNLKKIAENLVDSLVPPQLRDSQPLEQFDQPNAAGKLRDYAFLFYQQNLIFALGLAGGPFVLWLLCRRFWRRSGWSQEVCFWALSIPFIACVGIAVVGERDALGVAHATLLALEIIGIALIAISFPLRRVVAGLLLAGCFVDFALGVFLQGRMESVENRPGKVVYGGLRPDLQMGEDSPDGLYYLAWYNWKTKHQYALTVDWGNRLDAAPAENSAAHALAEQMHQERDANESTFHGWYSRHGGSIQLLGDDLAGPPISIADIWFALDTPSILLLLLFGGLVYTVWRTRRQFLLSRPTRIGKNKTRIFRKRMSKKERRRARAVHS